MSSFRFRLRTALDELLASLWFRPALITVVISLLALGSLAVDKWLGVRNVPFLNPGADDARAILTSITSSMLTAATFTFSILMVALVLASQQFSPRIIRNFQRDPALQYVMGTFIGTFLFGLLVLGDVSDTRNQVFVPTFSVLVAIILAIFSIVALIYLIHHVADIIHANTIVSTVAERTVGMLDHRFPTMIGTPGDEGEAHDLDLKQAQCVNAHHPGYIQGIDSEALFDLAVKHDAIIKVDRNVSDYVPESNPLMHVWAVKPLPKSVLSELRHTVDIGNERTLFQDVLFGVRQLVDVAIKALSPGINDPTTATNCIDYLGNILVQAARRPDPSNARYDDHGHLRIIAQGVPFERLLIASLTQIRIYGANDILVLLHVLEALIEVAQSTEDESRLTAVWRQVRAFSRAADKAIAEPLDRVQYNKLICQLADETRRTPGAALLNIDESALVDDPPVPPLMPPHP